VRSLSAQLPASAVHPLHIVFIRALETERTATLSTLDGFLTGMGDLK